MTIESLFKSATAAQRTTHFKRGYLRWIGLTLVFILAVALRLYNLEAPGLALDREYRSALIARVYYLEAISDEPDWRREIAIANKNSMGLLEPPMTEFLVSLLYRVVNGEHLWASRLLTSVFWLVGGVFLFSLVKRIAQFDVAIFSVAYYLLVPLGVLVSRSFQPESLMIMLFLMGLVMIVRYHDQPSLVNLISAALISGLAILVKPFILFALISVFFLLAVYRQSDWKSIRNWHFLAFLFISLFPTSLFYGYGILMADSLQQQVQSTFLPQLFLTTGYWRQWLLTATGTVGLTTLFVGLLGLPLLGQGLPRILVIGLWAGYFVFGLVFTNHIQFAGYYHLQLIVIIAVSIGPPIALVINHIEQLSSPWYRWLPVIGAFLLLILLNTREVRRQITAPRNLESVEVAQEVGKLVGHSDKVVYIASHYGLPLAYNGELSGIYWPRRTNDRERALGRSDDRGLSVDDRLDALPFSPEYFVITDFGQFDRYHADFKAYLVNNCILVAETDHYLVYESSCKN